MSGYDSWLESPYHDNEDEEDYIESQVEYYLDTEYNINDPEVVKSALLSDALFGAHWDVLNEAIQANDKTRIGLVFMTSLYDYLEEMARSRAIDSLEYR